MRKFAKALGFLAALLPSLALAQTQLPTLPANTVLGRLGTGVGPAQAIPFSQLGPTLITSNLLVTAPLSISGLTLSITGSVGKVLGGAGATFTATPTLGVASTTSGTLTLANSGNSGTVTIGAASTATTWTFKFPTTAGTSGQTLTTDGSGNTSWSAGAGTINTGTNGNLPYYTGATALSANANLNISGSTLTVGVASSAQGVLAVAGNTSGITSLTASAGTGTLTLPGGLTDTVVTRTNTDTLTNKTLTSPTLNSPTMTTPTLGIATATSINKVAITAPASSATLTIADGKTLTASNSLTFAGTDGKTLTTNASLTLAGTDGKSLTVSNSLVLQGTDTSILNLTNGLTVNGNAGTLTFGASSKALTVNNSIALSGTDSTTITFQGSDTYVGRTTTDTLTNKTLTTPTINGGTSTALTTLGIRSTGTGAFDLVLANTENLTAQRTLTFTLNNAARTINMSGNLTLAGALTTAGGSAITLTATGTTTVTLPTSGTLATIDTSQTFSGSNVFSALTQFTDIKLSSGKIYPTADGTTALQITKADGSTRIVNFDTTNARVGINKSAGAFDLDVNGAVNVGGVLTFGTLSATSLGASTSTITGLTVNNSPNSSNDYLLYYSAADGAIRKATVGSIAAGATAGVSSLNGLTGGLSIASGGGVNVSAASTTVTLSAAIPKPQGRLTLATATPVMTTTQSAKTTIYYTPYQGNYVPIYDGTSFISTAVAEISVATSDTTKNPAAIGASKVNDWFVWNDSGTIRISHGPDWTNDTTRSAGTALVMVNGILLNNASITNACAAQRCTYVGTTRSNGSSQLDYIFGASASGGTAGFFGVWNAYNRVTVNSTVTDSGTSYTYTSATVRQARASAGNQVTVVLGLQEDGVSVSYGQRIDIVAATGAGANVGVGLDSTTTFIGRSAQVNGPGSLGIVGTTYYAQHITVGIGAHVLSLNEASDGTNANTFNAQSLGTGTFSARM